MSVSSVSRQVRSLLSGSSDNLGFVEVLRTVDSFVLECSASSEQETLLHALDDELQAIHHDLVGHSSSEETQVFLKVLHHLRPILSSTSIITAWFDLVLRPALREPKLPVEFVNHAKELIICALEGSNSPEKVKEFRRRLMDLYLLDAMNEGSGDDVLEWADLDQEQRDKKVQWKLNLEDLLVKYGLERPAVSVIYVTRTSPHIYRLHIVGSLDGNRCFLLDAFFPTSIIHVPQRLYISAIISSNFLHSCDASSHVYTPQIAVARQLINIVHNRINSCRETSVYIRSSRECCTEGSPAAIICRIGAHDMLEGTPTVRPALNLPVVV